MSDTQFKNRSSEWIGDMTVWLRANAGDNSEQMTRLRRNLRRAREQELTQRQREMVALYYDRGMTMPQIAERLGVSRSTVSRTLRRARDRLYRFLRYTLWADAMNSPEMPGIFCAIRRVFSSCVFKKRPYNRT